MAFKIAGVIVVVATFVALQYFVDPQRVVERHVSAMRALYEDIQRDSGLDASGPVRVEWNERQDSLVRLGYLDRVEYVVPLAGNEPAQMHLYRALDVEKQKNWISDWNYRPGTGLGIIITVIDESWRHSDWKDTIDANQPSMND